MDLRRLRVGEWLCALSGVAVAGLLFAPWFEQSITMLSDPPISGSDGVSGFDALAVIDILLVLLGAAAVAQLVLTAAARTPAPGLMLQALFVPPAVVVTLVAFVRVVGPPDGSTAEPWAWLAVLACLGTVVGALVAMRDERLSGPDRLTDQTGRPIASAPEIPTLPAP